MEVLPQTYWQRCYVHFLRNALDYLPRKGGNDLLGGKCNDSTTGRRPRRKTP